MLLFETGLLPRFSFSFSVGASVLPVSPASDIIDCANETGKCAIDSPAVVVVLLVADVDVVPVEMDGKTALSDIFSELVTRSVPFFFVMLSCMSRMFSGYLSDTSSFRRKSNKFTE